MEEDPEGKPVAAAVVLVDVRAVKMRNPEILGARVVHVELRCAMEVVASSQPDVEGKGFRL